MQNMFTDKMFKFYASVKKLIKFIFQKKYITFITITSTNKSFIKKQCVLKKKSYSTIVA